MLVLVQRLAPGSSEAVSAVVISRYLPATLLAPALGNVADSREKRAGLVACSAAAGGCSALLCACRSPALLPCVYLLLVVQAAAVTQYDLFRRSLIPLLVPAADLQLSNTLDGLLWSLMLAVGASLGGFCVAALGVDASLAIDAASFFLSAAIFYQLAPPAGAGAKPGGGGGGAAGAAGASAVELTAALALAEQLGATASRRDLEDVSAETLSADQLSADHHAPRPLARELSCSTMIERESVASTADLATSDDGGGDPGPSSGYDPERNRNRSGREMFLELVGYLRAKPHMVVLCLLKASGSAVWCAADILQARFPADTADTPSSPPCLDNQSSTARAPPDRRISPKRSPPSGALCLAAAPPAPRRPGGHDGPLLRLRRRRLRPRPARRQPPPPGCLLPAAPHLRPRLRRRLLVVRPARSRLRRQGRPDGGRLPPRRSRHDDPQLRELRALDLEHNPHPGALCSAAAVLLQNASSASRPVCLRCLLAGETGASPTARRVRRVRQVAGETGMLGRLFSLEQSAQSAMCAASTYVAGFAADRGAPDTGECLALLACGGAITAALSGYIRWFEGREEGAGGRWRRRGRRWGSFDDEEPSSRGGRGGWGGGGRGGIGGGRSSDGEEEEDEMATLVGPRRGEGGGRSGTSSSR